MQYRFSQTWMRIVAVVLAALCLAGGFFYGMTWILGMDLGFLENEPVFQTTSHCATLVRNRGCEIIDQYQKNPSFQYWSRLLEDSDLRFIILDEETGEVKAAYLEGLDIQTPKNLKDNIFLTQYDYYMSKGEYGTVLENVYVCDYYFGTTDHGENWFSDTHVSENTVWEWGDGEHPYNVLQEDKQEASYQILYLLGDELDPAHTDCIAGGYRMFLYYGEQMDVAGADFAVMAVLFVVLALYLLVTAGRRAAEPQLHQGWMEKIPTDVMLVLGFFAGLGFCGCAVILFETIYNAYLTLAELHLIQMLTTCGAVACGMVVLGILYSFSVRVKAGTFLRSAWTYRVVTWCWKTICRLTRRMAEWVQVSFRSVAMVPRAGIVTLAVLALEFFLMLLAWDMDLFLLVLLGFNVFLFFAILWGVAQMRMLQDAAKDLADGNLDRQLKTEKMYWEFRQHGENLNAIAEGMNKAVEQRMKSERLKTELITNVSHDIKTPLTSIVNYVDLLQKPHSGEETVQYLEVLDRQAKRLKKLTENLVEASKASTGNLPVDLQPTSVLELLNQAVEEYRDRMEAGKLEIVMDLRGDLTVLADGKHMWRILDNLLNNVIKYAMPGTRVYVTAEKRKEHVVIAVKNISREPLNVNADELMERFVRGDSARSTEGSGLGLNIARSLTTLQNGQFDLTVDGDLFKAEIMLPAV